MSKYHDSRRREAALLREAVRQMAGGASRAALATILQLADEIDSAMIESELVAQERAKGHVWAPFKGDAVPWLTAPAPVRKRLPSTMHVCSRCGTVRSGPRPWYFYSQGEWFPVKPVCGGAT